MISPNNFSNKELTYFQVIPADIRGLIFYLIDPPNLQIISHIKGFESVYSNEWILKEYLDCQGLERYLKKTNDGLWWASKIGANYLVKYFVEKGATYLSTAMAEAAERGHRDIVELMINKGATYFNTAMAEAAFGGHREIVELMIKKGATDFDWAMEHAAIEGHREIVNYLQQVKERGR